MYRGKKTGVVVPAYNEEPHIAAVLEGMPDFVDRVYVVDDASTDATNRIASGYEDGRVVVIRHELNRGVGGAIVTGYRRCLADDMDIAAVMAGDNQMEPAWLPAVLDPVVEGVADYSKGTRQSAWKHLRGMSPWRRLGNFLLRWLTVIASGNPGVTDPQQGYSAASREALGMIDLDRVYPYYGYCNDLIVRFSAHRGRIVEIPMPSMYHGEVSKIHYSRYIPKVSCLLLRLFVWRITGQLNRSSNAKLPSAVEESTQ